MSRLAVFVDGGYLDSLSLIEFGERVDLAKLGGGKYGK